MQHHLPRNLAVSFGAAILLLLAGSWAAQDSLRTLGESVRWEQQTREVLLHLTKLLSTMQDAETGQRGFVLTGDPEFITPYRDAVDQIGSVTAALRTATADNPRQQHFMDELQRLIDAKFDSLRAAIDLVEAGRSADAAGLIAAGGGRRTMNDIRQLLAKMEAQEYALLADRSRDADEARRQLRLIVLGLAGLGLVLVLLLSAVSLRELRAAETSRRELFAMNQQLEGRVRERTAALHAANQELEAFVYSVSHDLRAPLRAVAGFAQILARRHRDDLNEEGRHYMDNVVSASARMGALIDDLLLYSRVGRGVVRSQPVPLAPLLQQLLGTLASRIESTAARIAIVEPLDTPQGDPTLLGQILLNLLDNALIYHRPGESPDIRIGTRRDDGVVVIEVKDNGIGVPPEYQEKIFEVFQRLHSDEEYPGTGIGLGIARKSARLMGGEISVESGPLLGSGSTFRVVLPADPARSIE